MLKILLVIFATLLSVVHNTEAVSLLDAVGSDNVKAISDALARPDGKKDLNKIGRGGQTPLMLAGVCMTSYLVCFVMLMILLVFLVLSGKVNAVRLLLEAGADATIGEENGYTPMHGGSKFTV